MRVIFSGYYGMCNYGDDLFGRIAYDAQRKYWPGFSSKILSPPIPGFDADFMVNSRFGIKNYNSMGLLGKLTRLSSTLSASLSNARVVYCGGSLFSGGSFGVRDVAERFSRYRPSAIGISIGPFKNGQVEQNIKRRLERFEFLAVRDQASYAWAESVGLTRVVHAGDIAGLIPAVIDSEFFSKVNSGKKLVIGFSPCRLLGSREEESEKFCDSFFQAVLALKKKGVDFEVKIICLNENTYSGDVLLSKNIYKKMRDVNLDVELIMYRSLGIDETLSAIKNLECYVTGRLHGAISAYMLGTKFLLWEYHRKCSDFLNEIGVPLDERLNVDKSLAESLSNILSVRQTYKMLPLAYRARAELNFTQASFV